MQTRERESLGEFESLCGTELNKLSRVFASGYINAGRPFSISCIE